jgi:hypothetical protein
LFIDDEPSKALQNPKWNRLFLKPFRGRDLSSMALTSPKYNGHKLSLHKANLSTVATTKMQGLTITPLLTLLKFKK